MQNDVPPCSYEILGRVSGAMDGTRRTNSVACPCLWENPLFFNSWDIHSIMFMIKKSKTSSTCNTKNKMGRNWETMLQRPAFIQYFFLVLCRCTFRKFGRAFFVHPVYWSHDTREEEWWLPGAARMGRNSTARELTARNSRRSPTLSVYVFHTVPRDAFYSQLQDFWNTRHFLMCYFWFCISSSLNVCLPRSEAWQQPSIRIDNWFSCSEFLQTKLSA